MRATLAALALHAALVHAYSSSSGGYTSSTDGAGSTPGTCDYAADTCETAGDGTCDVGAACPAGTDCLDCDPCLVHRSCGACAAAGCVWCDTDAVCASQAVPDTYLKEFGKTTTCGAGGWVGTCPVRQPADVYSDPAYDAQRWVYQLTKVESVWRDGVTGKGVTIMVNDDGVDLDHPDFAGRFNADASCKVARAAPGDKHGTTCAAIALAGANAACSVGIAPGAGLASCAILGAAGDNNPDTANEQYIYLNDKIDVSSNSWGRDACKAKESMGRGAGLLQNACPFSGATSPCGDAACGDWGAPSDACLEVVAEYCSGADYEREVVACSEFLDLILDGCMYSALGNEAQAQLVRGVTEGRGGKGVVYVFAAGNEYALGLDVNMEGWMNTRFTIVVGAVGRRGRHAGYSNTGAAVLVSAPGGDEEYLTNHVVAQPGGKCADAGVGTSYATPVVSGVVALMLEVNPALTWRDVQGVLATTAAVTDAGDASWVTTKAGLRHSEKYGFGIVDAAAAVAAARTWVPYGPEKQRTLASGALSLRIEDDKTAVETTLMCEAKDCDGLVVENAVVYLDLSHASRGDLRITLFSPAGTPSVLHPGKRPENTQLSGEERWKLATVRLHGEIATGAWRLRVVDAKAGDWKDCLDDNGWEAQLDGAGEICESMAENQYCVDGKAGPAWDAGAWGALADLKDASTGKAATAACCACGGGRAASAVPDEVRGWRLQVFGHGNVTSVTPAPTPEPAGSDAYSSDAYSTGSGSGSEAGSDGYSSDASASGSGSGAMPSPAPTDAPQTPATTAPAVPTPVTSAPGAPSTTAPGTAAPHGMPTPTTLQPVTGGPQTAVPTTPVVATAAPGNPTPLPSQLPTDGPQTAVPGVSGTAAPRGPAPIMPTPQTSQPATGGPQTAVPAVPVAPIPAKPTTVAPGSSTLPPSQPPTDEPHTAAPGVSGTDGPQTAVPAVPVVPTTATTPLPSQPSTKDPQTAAPGSAATDRPVTLDATPQPQVPAGAVATTGVPAGGTATSAPTTKAGVTGAGGADDDDGLAGSTALWVILAVVLVGLVLAGIFFKRRADRRKHETMLVDAAKLELLAERENSVAGLSRSANPVAPSSAPAFASAYTTHPPPSPNPNPTGGYARTASPELSGTQVILNSSPSPRSMAHYPPTSPPLASTQALSTSSQSPQHMHQSVSSYGRGAAIPTRMYL